MPGPPVPPTAKIPVPPTGLEARQVGERVVLRWTLQQQNTDGTRREGWPRAVVYRAFLADRTRLRERFEAQATVAYELPEQVVELFLRNDIVVFPDVLSPQVLKEQAGRLAVYGVKAVNEKEQDAGFSNLAVVRVYPTPRAIDRIGTEVTEEAVELRWEAPQRTTSGTPIEAIAGYRIYRSASGERGTFVLRGTAGTTRYRDADFRFGVTYFYRVRTVAQVGADTVESGDSVTLEVTPRDLFPPPAPVNLIAVAGVERVDLTWDASPAEDLAGYFVYRSRQPGQSYEPVNREAVEAQSLADTGLEGGARYYYVVTAVDREGNESGYSNEIAATARAPE